MRISRYPKKRNQQQIRFRINEYIRVPEVRVIDENNEHIGVLKTAEAMALAKERGFELVEINPAQDPPVAKFLDYGQFKYEREKELKKQKLSVKEIEIKGVRLSLRIGKHDLEMRLKQAASFLSEGNKIKVEIILKGRERQRAYLARQIVAGFVAELNKILPVKIEQPLNYQGGKMAALVSKS